MHQIREHIWYVSYSDLGKPEFKGPIEVKGLGTVHLDIADEHYIKEYLAMGYEPGFFVTQSKALNGWYVVISRHRAA